ncbi:polyadenylate-binding protein 2-like isoform X2 [Brassica napus]|uniref:polyadenylate-binding protein 2-like isoform X2 n=1 Tax=Brassica oleracea var. oleracea TaxID=109376 RepID=UPI0006A6ED4F|nr:PREDICTED: polyadenylate-binding protein 2-like isoform X2 [Brassica oleracea var. oleracea]XP_013705359.2 polyadenylate-binding protein 2-like isoform X2 [Brassica napus]
MDESKLKRCSTSSTHAEAVDEATDPLQNDKRELDDSETEVNSRKKQKQEEETTEKKKECCFDTKDAKGNNERTIFVTGFDNSGSRDEIRSALAKHFSSCGELTRVFVHIECETGVSRGYAFINLKNRVGIEAALTLNGSDLGGRKLLVTMARLRDEYYGHFNFKGCEICRASYAAGRLRLYRWNLRTGGGKFRRFSPEFEEKCRRHHEETMASRKMNKSKTKEG